MKIKLPGAAVAAALLGLSTVSFGQNAGDSAGTSTGSPRCDSMTGAAKDQCVRDENTKTEGSSTASPGADAATPGTGIGTGTTSAGSAAGKKSRCDALSGTQKNDCLRDEGTATSGAGSADRAGPGSTGMGR